MNQWNSVDSNNNNKVLLSVKSTYTEEPTLITIDNSAKKERL